LDITPALAISESFSGDILFHVRQDKYKVPRVRDFYRSMAANLASGMRVPLYPAQTLKEVEDLRAKKDVSFIFMGQEEYEENPQYFDELSKEDVVVAVSANPGFKANPGSGVLIMPKPLYGYPVVRVINEGRNVTDLENSEGGERPLFSGVKALIVDDEPMNLVVATGLFREYEMFIETARSGKEAVKKFREGSFDVIFMDHMMPEMDGVQAMKLIKEAAHEMNKNVIIIALTANVVSGAREMFMKEGFDGFIAKPISTADFERLMVRELRRTGLYKGGEAT
jgi:CheY-like chemotaxis protein